jgi:hypothetical protein
MATPARATARSAAQDRAALTWRRRPGRRDNSLLRAHEIKPPIVTSRANASASARMARSSMDIVVVEREARWS